MQMFSPDFLTVFSLISLSSVLVAWVLWLIGRLYWQQGLAFAVLSSLLYACAYLVLTIYSAFDHLLFLLTSKLLICLGISVSTLSIQQFRQSREQLRDFMIVFVPIIITVILAAILMPHHLAQFNELQSMLWVLQITYCLYILIQMRARTLGSGWVMVLASVCTQLLVLLLLITTKTFTIPLVSSVLLASEILVMWLLSLMLFLKTFLYGFGFLMMTRERRYALEQGKEKLDYLTQLPNKAALLDSLKKITQHHSNKTSPLSIMLIETDHFQKINAEHGHLMGDQIIQMLGHKLQSQCRASDIIARYSGNEFAILLTNTTIQGAEVLANRLCEQIRNHKITLKNGHHLNITISIGVHCCIPAQNSKWNTLFTAANAALSKAKSSGRDQFVISTPSMFQKIP